LLLVLSAIILALAIWLILEAFFVYNRQRKGEDAMSRLPETE